MALGSLRPKEGPPGQLHPLYSGRCRAGSRTNTQRVDPWERHRWSRCGELASVPLREAKTAQGLASSVSPVYLAEICPANLRGRLVTLLVVLITFGQVLSYIVGAVFFNVTHGWRWMFLSAVVPSLAQLVLTLSIPESPRYLIKRGNTTDARLALARVYSKLSAPDLEQVVARIERTLKLEAETVVRLSSFDTVVDALWRDLPTRRALIVACGLQFFQQATGFNR
jgi:SP family myo-inositol transporter-like MFS transporter 13